MSVIIDIKDLTTKQQKQIAKFLTIIPISKPTFNKNIGSYTNSRTGDIVKCFWFENQKVYIPYRFACCFFDKFFHQEEDYPRIFKDKNNKFDGKLLPRQIEPYQEVLAHLDEYRTATIALYPGFGKTFMGAMLAWELNYKTCVLVHRDNIGKQWIKTFKKYFKIDEKYICYVDNKLNTDAKIFVCMKQRTDKIPSEIRKTIGLLIIDEAHCFCSSGAIKPMLSFNPKYIVAETATPNKENGMFKVIQTICGEHYIQKISTKPYYFFLLQTKLDIELDSNSNNIFNDLLIAQCESEIRNKLIIDILKANKHYKTIISTPRKDHCELIKKEASLVGLDTSELYGKKTNYIPKNILIGTCSKMGVGFDEANFCEEFDGRPSDLLIMCQTFASWGPFEQNRGRGMRSDKPNVIMFGDNNSITKKHFKQIKEWVIETNGKIIEINIKDLKSFNIENWKMENLKNKNKKKS